MISRNILDCMFFTCSVCVLLNAGANLATTADRSTELLYAALRLEPKQTTTFRSSLLPIEATPNKVRTSTVYDHQFFFLFVCFVTVASHRVPSLPQSRILGDSLAVFFFGPSPSTALQTDENPKSWKKASSLYRDGTAFYWCHSSGQLCEFGAIGFAGRVNVGSHQQRKAETA